MTRSKIYSRLNTRPSIVRRIAQFGTAKFPASCSIARTVDESDAVTQVGNRSIEIVRSHRDQGTLLDEHGKISEQVLNELGEAGYWGMLVDEQFGGAGASMRQFARLITQMSTIEPTVAGLASVHGCIGAVDPVRSFGSPQQKARFLPKLADGTKLSAFALTEPGAGSDLTALKTTAVLDGDSYIVNGEKLFITNAIPGRTIGLVCLIDGKPSVLIVDLPDKEDDTFPAQFVMGSMRCGERTITVWCSRISACRPRIC